MNLSVVIHNSLQTPKGKEELFLALENDEQLFKETLEVILTLIISDPKLTFDVADLIESDYRNLYLVFMKKVIRKQSARESGDCCKEI